MDNAHTVNDLIARVVVVLVAECAVIELVCVALKGVLEMCTLFTV